MVTVGQVGRIGILVGCKKWHPKGVALLGGVALLEEVCHRGGGL